MQDYFSNLLATLARDPAGAMPALRRALADHPADGRLYLLIAAEYASVGAMDQAEGAFTAALQVAPGLAIARFQLGLLQMSAGRPAAARATWAPLLALPPSEPLHLFVQGLEALGEDGFDAAVAYLEQGMAANRTNAPLNHDMQQVIDRIAGMRPAALAPPPAAETPAGAHYLMSAYDKGR